MTSPQSRPLDSIAQMLHATAQARIYVEGMSKEDFIADPKTQDAVIMKILVIGELAARMLDKHAAFVSQHPQIPWQFMKGIRNRMAHGYFELDMDVIRDTVTTELPVLENNLRSIR